MAGSLPTTQICAVSFPRATIKSPIPHHKSVSAHVPCRHVTLSHKPRTTPKPVPPSEALRSRKAFLSASPTIPFPQHPAPLAHFPPLPQANLLQSSFALDAAQSGIFFATKSLCRQALRPRQFSPALWSDKPGTSFARHFPRQFTLQVSRVCYAPGAQEIIRQGIVTFATISLAIISLVDDHT